jgi:hypothetical protein
VLVAAVGQPNCEKGGLDEARGWNPISKVMRPHSSLFLQAFLDLTALVNERLPKDPEGKAACIAEISTPKDYPLADDDPTGPLWCSNAAVSAPLSPALPSDVYVAWTGCSRIVTEFTFHCNDCVGK